VVPYTGHSVISDEPTDCAREALLALLAGHPVHQCPAAPVPAGLRPPPLPPRRLALVSPLRGLSMHAGRTVHAVELSVADLGRQLQLSLELGGSEILSSLTDLRSGGLRAGWAQLSGQELALHAYSYVPGVAISGSIGPASAELRIGGEAAAHGTLRLASGGGLRGTLEGLPVSLPASSPAAGVIVGVNATASSDSRAGGHARRLLADGLPRRLPSGP